MKLLKKILIGLLILVVLLLVLAWFLPRQMDISVTSKVEAPPRYAYSILNDFKNQSKWDPWLDRDTTMTFAYGDKTLGEGAYVDYSSVSYGSGRTTRSKSIKDERIEVSTVSGDVVGATMHYALAPEDGGDATNLTWNFKTEMGWPMNLMSVFFSSSMKKEMKQGINKISTIANERWKKGTYDGYEVVQEVFQDRNYVTRRDIVPFDKADKFYTQNLQPLFLKIQKAGVEMEGKSGALVYSYNQNDGTLDMATAIPIKEMVAIEGAASETIDAGRALVVNFYGDRAETMIAHEAIDDYMRDRDLFVKYPVLEEYVTDPSEEPDPAKWLTRVIYYLAE